MYSRQPLVPRAALTEPVTVAAQFRGGDRTSQFLLTEFTDGSRELAWRGNDWSTWSPPIAFKLIESGAA